MEPVSIVIRYPGEKIDRHEVVPPGSASIKDEHYGGAARRPSRAVRPQSSAEHPFLALGHVVERFSATPRRWGPAAWRAR